MKRDCLLSSAYVGAPLVIGGRELCLSIGRYSLLRYWGNPLFNKDGKSTLSETDALGEFVMVCYLTKDELREVRGLTAETRFESVLDFMLTHDDELGAVTAGIMDRMKAIEAASVEIDDMGKQADQAGHALHSSPPSNSSQSLTASGPIP